MKVVNRNTDLFSTHSPDTILQSILTYAKEKNLEGFKLADDKYKLKLPIIKESGDKIEMQVKILKAGDEKVCIEFSKTEGDSLQFYEEFNFIKDYINNLVDATY